jgi:lysophospholipase L1-like esterase
VRTLALRFALLGASCLVALIAAEIALRVLDLAPSAGVGSVTEADFARVPGLLTPGQDIVDREKPALPYHVRINALGYRGAELPAGTDAAALRILAVGDSFTYGDFVDDEQTLPARLEERLRARCGAVTVINAGVGGTTLVTHEQMIRRARPLRPDVVLLTFSENDVVDLAAPMWFGLEDNRRAKSRFPLSVLYPVLRRTALWNFGLRVRATLSTWDRPVAVDAGEPTAEDRVARAETMRRLREEYTRRLEVIRDLVHAEGMQLVYALYPTHHSVLAPDEAEQMAWALRTGRGLGLSTVSLLPALRASGEPVERLYLLPHDGHPSPLGYELAAEALATSVDWTDACAPRAEAAS